jgi:[acyl-carrier-protein] S-malonyltransferase
MAEAGKQLEGTLAAVIGLEEHVVLEVCREADVDVCNLNLPAQTVIGGTPDRVETAMLVARERGASRVQPLNVSGAFHSRLMRPAAAALRDVIAGAPIADPAVPVVANATATTLTTADAVRRELTEQVASAVHWHESVTLMAAGGVQAFTEFGPGRVLTGLVRRIVPGAELANVSTQRDVSGQVVAER